MQLKKHKNLVEDDEDPISKLPVDILVRIFSLLSLKDAAVTSVLSQRWRYLWTFTANLNFDGYETPKRTPAPSRFIDMVNSVVDQHRGSYVDQFVVNFHFNNTFSSTIDAWVKFAMKKHLQALQLQFCGFLSDTYLPRYILDQQVFFDDNNNNNIAFKTLKVLRFRSVDVSDSVIHYLLSNCSLLEQLEVYDSPNVVNLSVAGPNLALKHLELRRCDNIHSIEICDAVNLVSFHCKIEPEVTLVVRNVPMLVDVYLGFRDEQDYVDHAFNLLSCCLSQLQILQLDVSVQVYMANREYRILPNIKQLNLMLARYDEYNLLKLVPFIKAFAYLQKLVLTILFRSPRNESAIMEPPTKCSHGYLKEVEVLGYSGSASDVQIITYLIENAVALEKINIKSFIFEEDLHHVFYQSVKDKDNARDHGIEQLKEKIPSNIEFICP